MLGARIDHGVHEEQHAVRLRHRRARAAHALGLDRITAGAEPGGIEQQERYALELDALAQHVAGGAGDFRDDGGVVAREPVEQRGLAGVGRAGDHHRESLGQQPALPCRGLQRRTAFAHAREPLAERAIGEEINLLSREIDGGLDVRAQLRQCLIEGAHARGKFALERTQRGARGRLAPRVDQVDDGFGLRQIQLFIEVGAQREFPGLRPPRPERDGPRDQGFDQQRSAVAVQFEHVLAGVGMRCRKIQRQPLVEGAAVGAEKAGRCRLPRRRQAAQHRGGDRGAQRSGDAHDGDAAPAGRRGRGDDRSTLVGHGLVGHGRPCRGAGAASRAPSPARRCGD